MGPSRKHRALEQRIGRLDRIGQTDTIHIHIPYIKESSEEVWAKFCEQGLGIFNHPVPTAFILRHQFEEKLTSLSEEFDEKAFNLWFRCCACSE